MADLARIAPQDLTVGSIENVEQGFRNDDSDIKAIYQHLNKLRGWYAGTVAPSSPNVKDKWQDTSVTPNLLKQWDGDSWVVTDFFVPPTDVVTVAEANKLLKLNADGKLPADIVGNATTASTLQTARKISGVDFKGDSDIIIPYSGLSGTPTIPPSFDDGHLINANGWQKLNNGLIIQWGGGTYATSVTFPIAFPNAVFSINVNGGGLTSKSNDNAGLCVNDLTLTGFSPFNMGDIAFTNMYWIAIGN